MSAVLISSALWALAIVTVVQMVLDRRLARLQAAHAERIERALTAWGDMRKLEDVANRIRDEIHHAGDNGHHLSADSQGVAPGEYVPAVRVDYVLACLEPRP